MARKPTISPKASVSTTKPSDKQRARTFDELREALLTRGTHVSLVEECLRFPFIDYGYRKTNSFWETFLTLFDFHNETMNIWSHLIGFFCVVVAGYHVAAEMLSASELHILEMIAFETFIVCAALCLLLSSIYHWFGCISEAYHNCLLRVDITGVGLLVAGSYFPAVYYGFYCSPDWQMFHFALTVFVLCAGIVAPWIDYKINGFEVRPFILASLVVLGVLPFGQWLYITPDVYRNEVTKEFVLMFLWYGMGFTLYLTKMPERFFPKSFLATQVFASHSLWHMCVLGAVYVSFHFYIQYRALLENHGCSAYGMVDANSAVSACDGSGGNETCAAAY